MKRFNIKLTSLIAVIFIFYFDNLKSQNIDDKQQTLSSKQYENYSPSDWTGMGMYRNYKPSDEIIEKRTRSSKHFRNSDGTITALIASGASINYEENGSWHSITREIEPNNTQEYSQYPYLNTHNAFKSFYTASGGSDGILTILKEGKINEWLNPKMYYIVNNEKTGDQAINVSDILINQNEILYKNLFNEIDIKFIQNNDGRKMDIILNNSNALSNAPSDATDLVFEETIKLPESWTIREDEGCINVFDEKNYCIARYEKPVSYDSGNEGDKKISGTYNILKLENDLRIEIFIPLHWLKQHYRKYPVIIDPTVSIYPANTLYYTGTSARDTLGNFTKNNDSLFHVCNTPYNPTNTFIQGFMKFDLSSISTATSISSGTINYYCYANQSTASQSVMFWSLGIDPVTSSANAIFSNNTSIAGSYSWSCSSCWYNWSFPAAELTNILNRKVAPGWAAYKMVNGNSVKWYNFYGYGNSTYKPYLTITYCSTPGTPTNLSTTVTGTTTATLSCSAGTPAGSPQVRYYWEVYSTGGVYITGNNTITTNTTVAGLVAGSSYYFRVQSGTSCDNTFSTWVTSQNFTTLLVSCTTPGTPVSLSSYVIGQTSVALQWLPGTPAGSPTVSYLWEIYTTGGVLAANGSTSGTSAIVSTLICGTTYYFRVRATTSCDSSYSLWAFGSNFITTACTCVTPGTPVNLYSTVTGSTTTDLYWSAGTPPGSPLISYYWEIYTLGGNFVTGGSSSSSPASASGLLCGTTYYFRVRAYTNCDGSYSSWVAGSNFTTNGNIPVSPSMLTSSINNLCSGTSGNITLSSSGGLGSIFAWYTNSCGTTPVGTNVSISLLVPITTTTYYARWESSCGFSTCLSISIVVITPVIPSSLQASPSTICSGGSANLSAYTSTGIISWWDAALGGNFLGTSQNGTFLNVSPTITTNYYAESYNSIYGCSSSRVSILVTVSSNSISASSATCNPSVICPGNATTLTLTGVSLATGANWYWYSVSCGGVFLSSGVSTILNPVSTTVYFVRAENTCSTTACVSVIVDVNSSSIAPSTGLTNPSNICSGASTTLSFSGGTLGTSATWNWYLFSCGGVLTDTGALIIQTPINTTIFYIRSEGICNTTGCISITVNIIQNSIPASSAFANDSTTCSGTTDSLFVTGGLLSSGANWFWYTGTCGGTYIGTGNPLAIVPTITDTYFVRAEGPCITTSCVTTTINISATPIAPVWAASDRNNFCSNLGGNITLTASGGSGTTIMWYRNSCGGNLVGSGNPKIITAPVQSTIYYVMWQIPACNNSACISRTVTVLLSPTVPGSLSTTGINLCTNTGGTILISSSGGNGNSFGWYTGSCGGISIGTGKNLTISAPTLTTTYWGRQQTVSCGNSVCKTLTIIVNTLSANADSISVTGNIICEGNPVSLSISGGTLGSEANWNWYKVSCAGTYVISGSLIVQSPLISTIYYLKAEGPCNTTSCVSKTITVINAPQQPSQITGNTNPTAGNYEQYYVLNDSNSTLYSWTYPSGWTGTSSSNSIICIVGASLGTITVIPSNSCGSGLARTLKIDGTFTLNGYFYYNNSTNPLDSIWVFLIQNGNKIDSVMSDINGFYQFNGVLDGTYNINATTTKPWSGVNATDAVKVKRDFAGSELFTSAIRMHAADVNLSYNINTTDAVKITRRFVGSDTSFARGDWLFEKPSGGDTINVSVYMNDTVIINGSNVIQNFDGICVGDVNASFVPPLKSTQKIDLDYSDLLRLNSNEIFELPIIAISDINVGAFSLILKYPKNFVTVNSCHLSVSNKAEDLCYNIIGDELRIGWYENESPINLKKNESLIIIKGKTTSDFKLGDVINFSIANNPLCEIADENGNPKDNVILKTFEIEHTSNVNTASFDNISSNDLAIYPNPAKNKANIKYNVYKDGFVKISLNNVLGEKIMDIINNTVLKGAYNSEIDLTAIEEGVYLCKMIFDGNDVIVKKVIISK